MKTVTGKSGKQYQVVTGRDICKKHLYPDTIKYFNQLMDIDSQVFGGDDKGEDCVYVGDVSGYIDRFGYRRDEFGWMSYDPRSGVADNIVAIMEDNKIIGYVNYLTMNDDLRETILNPDMDLLREDPEEFASSRDDGISGDQLRQWQKGGPNNLFILSIAVDKEHQDTDAIKVLTDSFLDEMRTKQNEGYDVTSISCDTVSDHGEDAMRMFRCDMAKTKDGKDLILPAAESDESGHDVHVRICEGENMEKLLTKGFDFDRPRLAKQRRARERDYEAVLDGIDVTNSEELSFDRQ